MRICWRLNHLVVVLDEFQDILNLGDARETLALLRGLARLGGRAPMSSVFLKGSGITQASSVQRALNRLMGLKIIFYYEDEYRFVIPFLSAWLLYKKL